MKDDLITVVGICGPGKASLKRVILEEGINFVDVGRNSIKDTVLTLKGFDAPTILLVDTDSIGASITIKSREEEIREMVRRDHLLTTLTSAMNADYEREAKSPLRRVGCISHHDPMIVILEAVHGFEKHDVTQSFSERIIIEDDSPNKNRKRRRKKVDNRFAHNAHKGGKAQKKFNPIHMKKRWG